MRTSLLTMVVGIILLTGFCPQAFPLNAQAGEWIRSDLDGGSVRALVVAPDEADRLYAATNGNGVFVSDDAGLTWSVSGTGSPLPLGDIVGGTNGWLYAVTDFLEELEVVRSKDDGNTWESIDAGLEGLTSSGALAVDPQFPRRLWLASTDRLFKSSDGGDTWIDQTSGLPSGIFRFYALAVDPNDTQTIYASLGSSSADYLWKSTNGGGSWEGLELFDVVWEIAVDPLNSNHLLLATGSGMERSEDGGVTREFVDEGTTTAVSFLDPPLGEDRLAGCKQSFVDDKNYFLVSSDGVNWEARDWSLEIERCYGVATSSPERVHSATRIGTTRSEDSGTSWTLQVSGLEAWEGVGLLADPSDPEVLFADNRAGVGYVKTRDGGRSWETSGDFDGFALKLANDGTTLYSVDLWDALFRSDDAGTSWIEVIDESEWPDFGDRPRPESVAIDPLDPAHVWLGQQASGGSDEPGGDAPEPVFLESRDAGVTWEPLFTPTPDDPILIRDPFAIAVDASDPQTVFSLVWVTPVFPELQRVEILRSRDGGLSVETVLSIEDVAFNSGAQLEVHPAAPNLITVFFRSFGDTSPFYQSQDGGDTWTEVPTHFPCRGAVRSIDLDAADPDTLYATCEEVFVTRDAGASWQEVGEESFPPTYAVFEVAATDTVPRKIWAGTSQGIYSYVFPPRLQFTGTCPGEIEVAVTNASPGAQVFVVRGKVAGSAELPVSECAGTTLGLGDPVPLVPLVADASGGARSGATLNGLEACSTLLQAIDLETCAVSKVEAFIER